MKRFFITLVLSICLSVSSYSQNQAFYQEGVPMSTFASAEILKGLSWIDPVMTYDVSAVKGLYPYNGANRTGIKMSLTISSTALKNPKIVFFMYFDKDPNSGILYGVLDNLTWDGKTLEEMKEFKQALYTCTAYGVQRLK